MKVGTNSIALLIFPAVLGAATLHLKNREMTPEVKGAVLLDSPGPRWTAGRSHMILQFHHAVNEELVQELNRRGAYVVGAVPDFGVVVSAGDDFSLDGMAVDWAGRLSIDDKISPALEKFRAGEETWFVAEFHPDVDREDARRLARAAGFRVHEHRDLIKNHLLLSGDPGRLPGLAQWDEVDYLFPASEDLIHGKHVGHCAGPLTSGGLTPMFVVSGSGWSKDAAGEVVLSYFFGDITPKLDAAQARQEIERALNAWTQYAPVKFVAGESATANRTVFIKFATGDHGDGFPFDGPGGVLAHTFYPAPPNPESIAGDMHLDGDENWHIGADTDLYTVAVHEAGHALGLAHTDIAAAVMYPYYRLGSEIAADDIAGIQKIYGSAQPTAVTTPVATPPLTLTIAAPAPNSTTTNSTQAISGTTSGAIGAEQMTWQTDHGASGSASGTASWAISAIPLVVGSNTITVTATDSSRKTVQTVSVTRTATTTLPKAPVNRTAPVISITSPAGGIVNTAAATIDVIGTASDNAGVVKVTWQCGTLLGTATGTTNWKALALPLLVGNNTIAIRAYDAAGQQYMAEFAGDSEMRWECCARRRNS